MTGQPVVAGQTDTDTMIIGRFASGPDYLTDRPDGARRALLALTVAGAGRIVLDGASPFVATRGTLAWLPAEVPHRYGTDPVTGSWTFWWAHYRPRPGWPTPPPGLTPLSPDLVTEADHRFADLLAAARWPGSGPVAPWRTHPTDPSRSPDPIGTYETLATGPAGWRLAAPQLEALLVLLTQNVADSPPGDERVARALALVAADPAAPHSLTRLADAVALSPSRLAHLARAELGEPLMRRIRTIRLAHAARLLAETPLTVAQVARASGFASPFHFSRVFAAAYGHPPSVDR